MPQINTISIHSSRYKHIYFQFILVLLFFTNAFCANSYDNSLNLNYKNSARFKDISISIEKNDIFPQTRKHGYAVFNILLENHSDTKSHKVELVSPAIETSRFGDYIKRITQSVELPTSSKKDISFLQPPMEVSGEAMEIIIDGRRQSELLQMNFSNTAGWGPKDYYILLSENVSFDDFNNYLISSEDKQTVGREEEVYSAYEFVPANTNIKNWPDNWLAYTSYDGIVLTDQDINNMPENVKSAILGYLSCGGSILIMGDNCLLNTTVYKQKKNEHLTLNYTHFGVYAVNGQKDVKTWDSQTWKDVKSELWEKTGKQFELYRTVKNVNENFKVVQDLSIPVRGLFLLVLLFAVLIGPVNLCVLSRLRKRIWMLWTVPLISIVTSGIVFSYTLLSEGLESYARTCTVTMLDQNNQYASTIGIDAFYCPLTPSGGLIYDLKTEVTQIGIKRYGNGRSRHIELGDYQKFKKGWIIGRVPSHFLIRKNQDTDKSVQIEQNNDNILMISNELGKPIDQLIYADKNKNLYIAENIGISEKAQLQPYSKPKGYPYRDFRNMYSTGWSQMCGHISRYPEQYIEPGMCIAILKENPFLKDALQQNKIKDSQSVIICYLEGYNNENGSE